MIEWNKVALEPSNARPGALLRERFGVWVGFVDADGCVFPVGDHHIDKLAGCVYISGNVPAKRAFEATEPMRNRILHIGGSRRTSIRKVDRYDLEQFRDD